MATLEFFDTAAAGPAIGVLSAGSGGISALVGIVDKLPSAVERRNPRTDQSRVQHPTAYAKWFPGEKTSCPSFSGATALLSTNESRPVLPIFHAEYALLFAPRKLTSPA